jgi:anti-sigma regulatory factor (Ser/Thr protein kinase)
MMTEVLFEREFPATTQSLAGLRQGLRHWLEDAVAEPARRTDVVIAASELAAAAMRNAAAPESAVAISAWVDGPNVVVESRAAVASSPARSAMSSIGDDVAGERGMAIIAALSDSLAVREAPNGVVVRARVPGRRFDPSYAG